MNNENKERRDNVNRLGNLLQFGQLFKACDTNLLAQIANIFR